MEILYTVNEVRKIVKKINRKNLTIALVPTMGFLHNGHKSLLEKAKEIADVVFMSDFVNPIQFGPNEDYDKYPRDFERDKAIALEAEVDYIFYPTESHMYKDQKTYVEVEQLSDLMCGGKRPGHFKGVCTIVLKLFNIIKPDYAIFGMKDAQQVRIIEKMVEDLNLDVKIIRGEILRESDGLAYSSRNIYLSPVERQNAIALYKTLLYAKQLIAMGERDTLKIKAEMEKFMIENYKITKIDYIGP